MSASKDLVQTLCPRVCGCTPTLVRIPSSENKADNCSLGVANVVECPQTLFTNDFTSKDNTSPIKQQIAPFMREIQASIHNYLIDRTEWYEHLVRNVYTGVGMKADVLTTIFKELKRIVEGSTDEASHIKDIDSAPVTTDSHGKPTGLSSAKLFEIFLGAMFSQHQLVLYDLETLTFARWPKRHFKALYPGDIAITNAAGTLYDETNTSAVANPNDLVFIKPSLNPETAWNRLVIDSYGKGSRKIHHKESFYVGTCGVFIIGYGNE